MGVHNVEVYPEIKKLLEMPGDEGLFIIRFKDMLGPAAVAAYRALYNVAAGVTTVDRQTQRHFTDHLEAVEREALRYQVKYPSRVKFPD